MTTAKNYVFIGLEHENVYLVGGTKIWYGGVHWGSIFHGEVVDEK